VGRRPVIDYRRGARLDDALEITVALAERRRTYLMLKQEALRQGEPMARALVQAACVRCKDFKPAPLPAPLAGRLAA
jgi:acyl-CoA thioesterase FadM